MLNAEAAMIMLVDSETQELYSRSAAHHGDNEFEVRLAMGEGIMGQVAQTGHFLNIENLKSTEYYKPSLHDDFRGTGIAVRTALCMPIFGYDEETGQCDKVVGVVEVLNKKHGQRFTQRDEDALAALCSHIATSLSFVSGDEP